jgi:hypothetical protein
MSLKGLIRIAEEYLTKHPSPKSSEIMNGMLKLTYSHTSPPTNSQQNK